MITRTGRLLAFAIPLFLLLCPLLRADEIRFKNGEEIKDCLVRDEGRIMRVWLSREEFPDRSIVHPRDDVEHFRIRRSPEWDDHEMIQDLSVTHIELSPPLIGLHGVYHYDKYGAPSLKAREGCAVAGRIEREAARAALPDLGDANRLNPEKVVEGLKLSYEPGEELTLVGHVKNTGFARAEPFDYVWELNGEKIGEGRCGRSLEEMEIAKFEKKFKWPGGHPVVRFKVIPGRDEIARFNDERKEDLSGWAFDYTVTHRRIAYSHQHRNTLGSFSWEDYYQWHLDIMNQLFAESIYPAFPRGIESRVRLNRIFYLDEVEDGTIDDKVVGEDGLIRNQGAWHFRDNEREKKGEWWRPDGNFNGCVTEWSLPHELGHQLGLIDLYNFDYHGREGFPVAGRAEPLRFSHFFRHPRVMMHWHGPHLFHEVHAEYLMRTRGAPRGAFGDFIFHVPDRCFIQVLDVNSRPVPDAEVLIYQRGTEVIPGSLHRESTGVEWWDVEEVGRFEPFFSNPPRPVIRGFTDRSGFMELPNRPVHPVRTLNGYERRPNPFGNMNVVGQRGLMLALVSKGGRTNPFFLELIDFNLACIRGRKDRYVQTLKGDFPSIDGPPPPACARLEFFDEGKWRMHWKMPDVGKDTSNRSVHRFRIYRRTANEGMNFDPWDPVATKTADAQSHDLPPFPPNPSQAVGVKRHAYGITSVNERGVESGVKELFAPDMHRIRGLIRGAPYGDFYLTLEGDVNLVKLGPQGVYEDATPVGTGMEKAGGRFAVNPAGRTVSTAWDRHGVNLYKQGFEPRGCLGEPFRHGEAPGRFWHPHDCAIDETGSVAVADGNNRRVQVFSATDLWEQRPSPSTKPALVIDGYKGNPFDCRPRSVAFDHGLLIIHDERGRLYLYRVDLDSGRTAGIHDFHGLGPNVSLCIEDEDTFLLLDQDRAWLRRYRTDGLLLDETCELNKEKLKRPRGLVKLKDGRVATFQDLNRLLVGQMDRNDAKEHAKPLPELEGVYAHPLRYERPELRLKVLVINYEPLMSGPDGKETRLTKLRQWNDPKELTEAYCRELRLMSGGCVACEIKEWKNVDGWPVKVDGFVYDDATYKAAMDSGRFHDPDGMDYLKLAKEHDLAGRIARGEIDEVWVWGGPGFGYYESRMFGPGAYWCNSTGIHMPESERLFVVMGFNYERGVAEMIHDLGHRIESIMSRVYENDFGPWKAERRLSDWERFSCVDFYVNGRAAVGNCHFPCNGTSHYDYANTRVVKSRAADWLNYPRLSGESAPVDRESWADPGGNYHLGYMRWFFSHLPRAPGRNHEGKLCNWWHYLFDMSTWPETR